MVNGVPMSLVAMKNLGIEVASGLLQTQFYSAVDPYEDGSGWYLTQMGSPTLFEKMIKYYGGNPVLGEILRLPDRLSELGFWSKSLLST